MRIGITGANGFVGQALCTHLFENHHLPVAITRKEYSKPGLTNFVVTDFSDYHSMVNALSGCQALVILASQAHSGSKKSENNLSIYRRNNIDTAIATIKAAKLTNIKRVIYLSSIKVNGEETFDEPFTINSTPHPQDSYGITKYETELALTGFAEKNGMELCIIRSPLIYGKAVKGNLALLEQAIKYGIPLPFASIKNKRDLISLPTLCGLITLCLNHPDAGGQIFLAADGQAKSTAEIVHILHASSLRKPILLPCPQMVLNLIGLLSGRSGEIRRMTGNLEIDISHTCQTLNWQPNNTNTISVKI